MALTPQVGRARDGAANIKRIGRTVIRASLFVIFMTLVGFVQMGFPPMGDIGHFVHDSSFVLIPMALWGVGTGIGLRRGWRWSRISMLIFGGLLTLFCAVPALGFFLIQRGGLGWLQIAGLRSIGLLFLIPSALVVRWYGYFVGEEARAYFRGTHKAATSAV
jgi:hypothetical protein